MRRQANVITPSVPECSLPAGAGQEKLFSEAVAWNNPAATTDNDGRRLVRKKMSELLAAGHLYQFR